MPPAKTPVSPRQLLLSPNRTAILLGCIALGLALASTAAKLLLRFSAAEHLTGLVNFLDMDKERNLPSFFSAGLLFLAAQLLFLISRINKGKPRGGFGYWLALAIIFLYMTFDEAFSVHEPLSSPIKQILDWEQYGLFYFAWVIPGMLLVAITALVFLRFWWNLPRRTRWIFLLAAGLYILGSIGFEMLSGRYAEFRSNTNLTYSLITFFEESLEMAGIIVFIWGLLLHLEEQFPWVTLRFANPGGEATGADPQT